MGPSQGSTGGVPHGSREPKTLGSHGGSSEEGCDLTVVVKRSA